MTTVVDFRERSGVRVELVTVPDTDGTLAPWDQEEPTEDIWGVQLCSGGDSELEVLRDEWEARAHFRSVCLKALGVSVPYQAPALAGGFAGPDKGTEAASVFYHYHGRLKRERVGSDLAIAIRDEAMADPLFVAHAQEIFDLIPDNGDWVNASLRVICRRITRARVIEEQKAEAVVYDSNPRFGMF